jgi:hypothetical protein
MGRRKEEKRFDWSSSKRKKKERRKGASTPLALAVVLGQDEGWFW